MTESNTSKITGYSDPADIEHDEYHSSLEVDDSSGWRVFIVPALAILFLIGAIALFFAASNDATPDPRVQARLMAKQQEQQAIDAARARAGQSTLTQPATAAAPAANTPAQPAATQ
jgi:hypothetical protein